MDRVALIGHSRGGEAIAIAAAFNQLGRYPDDATLEFNYDFDLRGVIAIAPADGQYKPRARGTPINNVNYFTIHGSQDGDVQSFMGTSQYSRVEVSKSDEDHRFKSSLYVVGANHGQFNTSWGRIDVPAFWSWTLDTGSIMNPQDQRNIARVYFSAFLEIVLRDRFEYLPIFTDARYAASWLPDTFYINQYADSLQRVIADFEEDIDPATTTVANGRITGENLTKWRESYVRLKWQPLDTHVASQPDGRVIYELKHPFSNGTTHFVFEPMEFLAKLATLIPRPRANLTRYHGVLAPNAKYRKLVVPTSDRRVKRKPKQRIHTESQPTLDTDQETDRPLAPLSWAERLKRVFKIDRRRLPTTIFWR